MIEKNLIKGTPDWHKIFNTNASIIDDKLTPIALCSYDQESNLYLVELSNVPAVDNSGTEFVYPDAFPDIFSVTMKFPNAFVENSVFRIGKLDFTPVYAGFAAGDTQQVNFDKVNRKCFFASGGQAVVFSASMPAGNWMLWLEDLGEIDFPFDKDNTLMLNTAPLSAEGEFVVVDDTGAGETITNMTSNPDSAEPDSIIVTENQAP